MSDRKEAGLLLALGLSPSSVLLFLLFALPVEIIVHVFVPWVSHRSRVLLIFTFLFDLRPDVRTHHIVPFLRLHSFPCQ